MPPADAPTPDELFARINKREVELVIYRAFAADVRAAFHENKNLSTLHVALMRLDRQLRVLSQGAPDAPR